MKQLDKSGTAFWHRDALWWSLSNHFFPKDVEMDSVHIHSLKNKSRRNHEKFIKAMGNSFSGYYAGYIDRSSSSNSSMRDRNFELHHGNNAHRVRDIKFGRDPDTCRVFLPYVILLSQRLKERVAYQVTYQRYSIIRCCVKKKETQRR